MNELETYPFLEEWLEDYISNRHFPNDDIITMNNQSFAFGCRYEFDIIAAFQTHSYKKIRLYNIEVKIDGKVNHLMQQALRNNANWFDYVFIATPLNNYLDYYINQAMEWYNLEEKVGVIFGWLIFDWKTKRTWIIRRPKQRKHFLGRKERNEIISRLGFQPENLLLKGY